MHFVTVHPSVSVSRVCLSDPSSSRLNCLIWPLAATIIGLLLGRPKTGQIGKVVTLSRWPELYIHIIALQNSFVAHLAFLFLVQPVKGKVIIQQISRTVSLETIFRYVTLRTFIMDFKVFWGQNIKATPGERVGFLNLSNMNTCRM